MNWYSAPRDLVYPIRCYLRPTMQSLFHLAYHVTDLEEARKFYRDVLGCAEGRSTDTWVDFNFFGHQLSLHLGQPFATDRTGHVGEHRVMMPHFGAVLPLEDWLVSLLHRHARQRGLGLMN